MYSDVPLFFFPSAPLHVTLKMTFSTFFFFFECFCCICHAYKYSTLEIQNVVTKEQAQFKYRHY